MSNYIVELKPIGSFFFGGERTLKPTSEEKKNNIVKSNKYPQQSSILGMLRKEILVAKKIIKSDWDYKDLDVIRKNIGESGFTRPNEEETLNYGVIKNISPIFISAKKLGLDEELYLMRVPMDHNCSDEEKYNPYKRDIKCRVNYCEENQKDKEVKIFSDFCSKSGISEDFVVINSKEHTIVKSEDIFEEESNIGIKLNNAHTTDEDSLFRINRYKFKNDKSRYYDIKFIFNVEIDDEIEDLCSCGRVVSLGGEGSYFNIKFEKKPNNLVDLVKKYFANKDEDKVILLSDSYIKYDEYEKYCSYSVSSTIDFRCFTKKDTNYKKDTKEYDKLEACAYKYTFLEKGSVLFAYDNEIENLKKSIESKKNLVDKSKKNLVDKSKENLVNIGYNYFI